MLGTVTEAEAKNLEAISQAIDQHNSNCPFPAAEVRMNPFEAERLGWEQIRGLPIVADPEIGTGRFKIICSRDMDGEGIEEAEALGIPIEVAVPSKVPTGPHQPSLEVASPVDTDDVTGHLPDQVLRAGAEVDRRRGHGAQDSL